MFVLKFLVAYGLATLWHCLFFCSFTQVILKGCTVTVQVNSSDPRSEPPVFATVILQVGKAVILKWEVVILEVAAMIL